MSKLDEIKGKWGKDYPNSLNGKDIVWLIEQAEKVKILESMNKELLREVYDAHKIIYWSDL